MAKLKKAEINKLAKQIRNTNLAVWNAITLVEDLLGDENFKKLNIYDEKFSELFNEIANIYKNLNGSESMAEPEQCGSYWQEFQYFGSEFQKYIDDVD